MTLHPYSSIRRHAAAIVCLIAACGVSLNAGTTRAPNGGAESHLDPVDAGRPAISIFRDKEGLPQNAAMAISFDTNGYLWVATQDGLSVYNGREWTTVNLPNRTESNFVRAMVVTADGAIWCGRENGSVSRLLNGGWDTWGAAEGGPRSRVNAIAQQPASDGSYVVWVATNDGLARFDQHVWRVFGASDGLPNDTINDVAVVPESDGTPRVWAATSRGLARFDGSRFEPVPIPFGAPNDGVQCLAGMTGSDGGRALWAAIGLGSIAILDGGTWRSMTLGTSEAITCITETVAPDGARTIWVGTDGGGLRRLQHDRWRTFDNLSGMPNNSIWCLRPVTTPNGTSTLWVGTDGGVARIQLGGWVSFDTSDGLPANSVFALCETIGADGARELWIGSRGGGLVRYRDGRWTSYDAASGLPSKSVFSLLNATNDDGSQTLWAGTQGGGVARFDGERWRPADAPGASRATVRNMIETVGADGKHEIWAATGGTGLLRYRDGSWSVIDTTDGLGTRALFSVVERSASNGVHEVWVGTQGRGVGRLSEGKWTVFDTSNSSLPNDSVLSLHLHRNDAGRTELWAGTEGGGAAHLDLDDPAGQWQVLSDATTPALPNNTAYQIREDAHGRLYIFTNKGCARLTPRQPTLDDASPYSVYVFRTEDGLPSNEFNGGASYVDSTGRIWAGTPAGAAVLDPAGEVAMDNRSPLYVHGYVAREGGAMLAAGRSLKYNESNLSFDYCLLSYFREKDTRYRTQLVGLEEAPSEWTADFKRSFSALPVGSYVFRVWARDYAGTLYGPVDIAFDVRAAPWKTWWAYALYLLALAAATYLVVQWRLAALRRRNEELELGIAERTAEIAEKVLELEASEKVAQAAKDEALRAKEEALEANRAKSVFLSNMSHELRTPLNAVLGFAQLMERDERRDQDDRENLAIIMRSGEHLLGLINDVLSISKIEAGKLTLNEQPFDLRRMLQGIEEMLGDRATAKGLRLMVDVPPDLPQNVLGDEGKLRQVLINLLNNALKFTDAGGVALRVRWADDRGEFEVEDTGKGIAPEEIDGIFEAFVQSETGRTAKEGTGLGLAISRSFVQLMGGDISVRSELGKGTVFRFDARLPFADALELPRSQRRVRSLAPGQPVERILVTDDRWENRALLVKLLRSVGFEVREAADGREAVDVWQTWKPALIWMDMRMPVMDGRAATREIRRREGPSRSCKIVALTASAFEHERGAVLAAGCDDFVTKPYRESTIFEKLEEHLGTQFVYDEPEAEPSPGAEGSLSAARLGALPPGLLEELQAALVLGNVKDAQFAIDNIQQHDAALADELRRRVRGYRFDEILDAIETRGIT